MAIEKIKENIILADDEPIHEWFELSYAQYLTIPRTVLQSMPTEWQRNFVDLLKKLDGTINWRPDGKTYWVQLKDNETGEYCHDELADYQRGRRILPYKFPYFPENRITTSTIPEKLNAPLSDERG